MNTGGHTFCLESFGNPVKTQSIGPEHLHSLHGSPLSFVPSKRLPALTAVSCGPLPHPSAPEFQNDLALVVLCHRPHQLTHQDPSRIARHQVRLGDRDESK